MVKIVRVSEYTNFIEQYLADEGSGHGQGTEVFQGILQQAAGGGGKEGGQKVRKTAQG